MKTIDYFLAPSSPYTYLGHRRLVDIARRHGARIAVKPFDLGGTIFPASGGLPLSQRPPQRLAYRLVELKRWSLMLNTPMNLKPKFFPVASDDAARLIIAADAEQGADAALRVAGILLKAVWADERNIADRATLVAIAGEAGLDGQALFGRFDAAQASYQLYTREALDQQVFGAPWYVYQGEPFWGQDRLDFLERALAQ